MKIVEEKSTNMRKSDRNIIVKYIKAYEEGEIEAPVNGFQQGAYSGVWGKDICFSLVDVKRRLYIKTEKESYLFFVLDPNPWR